MPDPKQPGLTPAPQFGYTVDENLLPHRRVPRPAAVWVAMALLPVIALLGAAVLVLLDLMDSASAVSEPLPITVVLLLGLAGLEALLWRGLAESRVVVLAFTTAGLCYEYMFASVLFRRDPFEGEPQVPTVLLVALIAVVAVQLLAIAGLVAALCRRDVGAWFQAVRRLRFERRGRVW